MHQSDLMSTEFPAYATPVLNPRPFTDVQLRAFELYANGATPSTAMRTAVGEAQAPRARRARRNLAVLAAITGGTWASLAGAVVWALS